MMYIFKNSTKRTVAAICTMLLVVGVSLSPFTSISAKAEGDLTKAKNIVEKINITFTDDDDIPDGYVMPDGQRFGNCDVAEQLKGYAEAENYVCWLSTNDDIGRPEYQQEYKGTKYAQLDFGDVLDNFISEVDFEKFEGLTDIQIAVRAGGYETDESNNPVKINYVTITYTFKKRAAQNNGGSTGGSNKSSSDVSNENSSDEPAHTHNYELKTITEPTAEQDGLEAYVCTICGAYGESVSVPASAYNYACTDAAGKVLTAKQNDTLVLEMGRWNSYPKWFMENLASRSDLTIKIRFEYQNKQYELTIPAGTKIETECDWYGPLKLCSLYEYTVK